MIKIELRDGAAHSSTGVIDFMQPILDEFNEDYSTIPLLLRGDSAFATPKLYEQCEKNGVSYVIRLRENNRLHIHAQEISDKLINVTKHNQIDYAVEYGEFWYQADLWDYPRRVVCKVEKPVNQFTHLYTFIVTNMDSEPYQLIKLYCKRGAMENNVKEAKNGFDFASASSSTRIVNANRFHLKMKLIEVTPQRYL